MPDLSTTDVLHALSRVGLETVKHTDGPNQLRIIGRVRSQFTRGWMVACNHLLSVAEPAPWDLDLSRQYFRRAGQLVYAWRLIFQGKNFIVEHYPAIVQAIANSPKARFEVEEQALPVLGQRSMQNARGKGAAATGTVPLIIRQKGMGQ